MQAEVDQGKGSAELLTTAEREELRVLRKENRVLRQERDILKRATSFLSKNARPDRRSALGNNTA
jgi:transposase